MLNILRQESKYPSGLTAISEHNGYMTRIANFVINLFLALAAVCVFISLAAGIRQNSISTGLEFFGAATLFAGAAALVGAFIGFLFGIPRALQGDATSIGEGPNKTTTTSRGTGRAFRPNTNLEQISDWLTKIIVGISLINATKIVDLFNWIQSLATSGFPSLPFISTSSQLICIYAFSSGFLGGYLLTRVFLLMVFERTESLLGAQHYKEEADHISDIALKALEIGRPAIGMFDEPRLMEIAAQQYSELRNFPEQKRWANVQSILGAFDKAANAYVDLRTKYPSDIDLAIRASFALRLSGRPSQASEVLESVPSKPPNLAVTDLDRKRVSLELARMFSRLYGDEKSIDAAIKIGTDLQANPIARDNSQLWFYLASAYGTKWQFRKQKGATQEELDQFREKALEAARNCLNLDDRWFVNLKMIWDPNFPNKKKSENDLEQFFGDKDFARLLGDDNHAS